MPTIKTEFSCPKCKKENGVLNQIVASGGSFRCLGNNDHIWSDAQKFSEEGLTVDFKVEMPRDLPQADHTPMTITVPIATKEALEKKYEDRSRMNATISSLLQTMAEGKHMLIPEVDIERIFQKLKELGFPNAPRNSSELFGILFTLGEKVEEEKQKADNAARDLQAYQGISIGRVIVNLGEVYQQAVENARAANLPLPLYCEQNLKNAISNNWF